jgi:uncharacterized protein DUF4412
MNWRLSQSAAIMLVAATVPAFADLTIVSKLTGEGKTETATSYLSANKARMVQPGGHEIIVDGTKGEMILVDHNKKEYSVMTKQEMEQGAARMQEQMKQMNAQMEEAMKNAPPETREQMKKMMGSMGGGGMAMAVDVKKGTGGRQIAGYKCDNWIVTIGGMSKTEECLSTDLQFPSDSWQAFRSMEDSMQSPGVKEMKEKLKEAKGFPLASTTTTTVMGKTQTSSTEVQEIKKDTLAPNVFELPAGYKKVDSPMKEAMKPAPAKK